MKVPFLVRKLRHDDGLLSTSAALTFGIAAIGIGSIITVLVASTEAASAADAAAQSAVRAATKAQTPAGAERAAREAVDKNAETSLADCELVDIDVGAMLPGEAISVVVTCESSDAGYGQWATLGRTYEGEATEVIDAFRTGE